MLSVVPFLSFHISEKGKYHLHGEGKSFTPEQFGDFLAGIVANYCGEADEQQVITGMVVPPLDRYDASKSSAPLKHQSAGDHAKWLAVWEKCDLSHVYGFPSWEVEVHNLLQAAYPELSSIFAQYAKSGSAGSSSAAACETMQQTELVDLALDCDLPSEAFPMVRVQNIFERADQVTGGTGDGSLEMHEFLEAVVLLAFERAQPKFGTVGLQRQHKQQKH